jgi:hypothetical protein
MMNWISRLFGSWDRQQNAADRAAVALEQIAEDLEHIRDTLSLTHTVTTRVCTTVGALSFYCTGIRNSCAIRRWNRP